ncbi:MAG: CHAT domain-containing protein [Phenylobacterium sp.]|jgi:CHAT domain-containing protein
MKTFYTSLKQHNGNSVKALRLAQLKFSRQGRYRKPLFWAGFVLTSTNKAFTQPTISAAFSFER